MSPVHIPAADSALKWAGAAGILAYAVWLLLTALKSFGSDLLASHQLVTGLLTFATTFAGAYFAFKLQARQREVDEHRKNLAAGNRALITLFRQWSSLKLYQKDMIEPHRESSGRHFQIRPNLAMEEGHLTYDIESLDFLVPGGDAQLLVDLLLEEVRFRETSKAINVRSELHYNEVQPQIAAANILHGSPTTLRQLETAVGVFLIARLRSLTDDVVSHVDANIASLLEVKVRLREALLRRYPHPANGVIDMEDVAEQVTGGAGAEDLHEAAR